jgi:hypothetical protein
MGAEIGELPIDLDGGGSSKRAADGSTATIVGID